MDIKEVFIEAIDPPKTLIELADRYKFSDLFKNLANNTRRYYEEYIITLLKSPYGTRNPNEITPRVAQTIHKSIVNDNGPNRATLFVSVWSTIFKFAVSQEWIQVNPWSFVSRTQSRVRSEVWTEKLVMALVKEATANGQDHIAKGVMLMYDTAQRPGDVLAMTHSMVKSDEDGVYVELRQSKTDTLVKVALTLYTARLIGDGPIWEPLVGKGISLPNFRLDFHKVAKKIGLPKELQLRDLRRTAITEAGDGGATDDAMVGLSGHKDRAMLDRYSVKTRRDNLAAQRARYADRKDRFD